MKIKHYEIEQNNRYAWYGLKRLGCPNKIMDISRREHLRAKKMGCISEGELEVDCFLSIVQRLQCITPIIIECGAGWGEWIMALAGVLKHQLVDTKAKTYIGFAIEGDKDFFEYLKLNISRNGLSAWPIHGAISNHEGTGYFNTGFISKNCCGGSIAFNGYFKGSKTAANLLSMANTMAKTQEKIRYYTIDGLVKQYALKNIDILHIDIQGAEVLALEGAQQSLGVINYMIIGTHGKNLHSKVRDMLSPTHNIIVDSLPGVSHIAGLPPAMISKGQDGLLLFERKGTA